ncbi:MAG TPA: class I SAM-dependent DNA methyltransferase [Burkholderiaceae bacterium]|nr:class I SAM-dependent DNA methyltransferase [Burkholderiaceae bacterium]
MPLSWNEIKTRAIAFSKDWSAETSERAEAQSFWNAFFHVFGIERRRVASFEKQVAIARTGHAPKHGRIDGFWKGTLLIEHKSAGQNLDRAFAQAVDYFDGLPERDLPRYVLVSDFARLRLCDLETASETEFALKDLHKHIKRFGFIAGYRVQVVKPQDPVNLRAAERMGALHDALKKSGYTGHPLEVLLVRLLFCLFADDTGIFQPAQAFRAWIDERTAADGSDLGPLLAQLFQVLDTPEAARSRALDEQLAAFPYVNGALFAEALPLAAFDAAMRDKLLDACAIDWSAISPAIFGALFQSIMDDKARRNLGAHYTSEENIQKLIKPLFLDELRAGFERIKGNRNKLFEFHKKLRTLHFLDPACGCGNFLVITYRELRLLELDVLRAAYQGGQQLLDIHQRLLVDVDQFHGIEIEEFPAQIAQVALWLIDHQMNVLAGEEFGLYFARIPLAATPHIVHGNALRLDWEDVLPASRCSYVMGNPPFVGKQYQSSEQKADLRSVMAALPGSGVLDFVAAWYVKAVRYVNGDNSGALRCAFVSTNSITQGEQVAVLWGWMLAQGVKIAFAHRTFQWGNEARGVAAVHCVIIGFGLDERSDKTIYEYEDIRGEPHAVAAGNINPYLVDAPDIVLRKRRASVDARAPRMAFGSMPNDGGHLLLSDEERDELLQAEPAVAVFVRRLVGSEELINGRRRWCLWLVDASPQAIRLLRRVSERVALVRAARLRSSRRQTVALAETPTLFAEIRQPLARYLAVPEVSSEVRRYIPLAFLDADVVATNKLYTIEGASMWHFGVLQSAMHMAWTRGVCGRLESRYQYSAGIVYNNFPWPESPTAAQRAAIESAVQAVLDSRAAFPGATLADLYDPLAMPPALLKAHHKLDAAVDAAYGRKGLETDALRVAFLFELYQHYTSLLPAATAPKRPRRASAPRE